jgi:hypothetical protein
MSEDTSDFSVDLDGGMTPPTKFTYSGHQSISCALTLTVLSAATGKSKSTATFGAIFSLVQQEGRLNKQKG